MGYHTKDRFGLSPPALLGPDGLPLHPERAAIRPPPPGLNGGDLATAARDSTSNALAVLGASPDAVARVRRIADEGESLLLSALVDYLALCVAYFHPDASCKKSPSVMIGGTSYEFLTSVDVNSRDTLDLWLWPTVPSSPRSRRPAARLLDTDDIARQFARVRLRIPDELATELDVELMQLITKAILDHGYSKLRRMMQQAVGCFAPDLSRSLYDCVRKDDPASDDFILATIPGGRGGQILYLADESKTGQIVDRVTSRARQIGRSSLSLAAELVQNRMGYQWIHARTAIERDAVHTDGDRTIATTVNLYDSIYRDDFDTFTEAEIGWFGSQRISLIPFLNTENESLMAVCKEEDADRISRQLGHISPELIRRFREGQEDAVAQLDLLNAFYDGWSPWDDEVDDPVVSAESAGDAGPPATPESRTRRFIGFLVELAGRFTKGYLGDDH